MDTQVSEEEYNQYLEKTETFITESEIYIKEQFNPRESDLRKKSLELIDLNFIQARRLSTAIIYFLMKCKSGIAGNSTNEISEKLVLIVSYFQGFNSTEELILKGQYIKASALLKQDFEVMTRIKQINNGKALYGKTPNVTFAPEGLKFVYGELNDIAHISKGQILGYYLERDNGSEKGVSFIPTLKIEQLRTFYLYHITIVYEIVTDAISLYKEMYEIDENYKKARIYHKVLHSLMYDIMNDLEKEVNNNVV